MSDLTLFAPCPRGVEPLLVAELTDLGAREARERRGGVAFTADLEGAYRACLWSRLASRVLLPLTQFPIADAEGLFQGALGVDWPALFELRRSFAIEVAGHSPAVTHTHFAGLKVKDAISDRFRERHGVRPSVDTEHPDLRIHLHMDKNGATLSLDLVGEGLHRHGYRVATGEAPLKENLACALLVRAGWPQLAARGAPLFDPLCGSGTLLIEGAWMAGDVAPGLLRTRYGFEAWSGHDAALWSHLRDEAQQRSAAGRARLPPLAGRDLDPRVLQAAQDNAVRAGLAGRIRFEQGDATSARPPFPLPGLLIANPPYGERLGAESEIIKLYSLLGETLKHGFPGWHVALFTGRPDLAPRLGLRARSMHSFYNGALPAKLLCFDIAPAAAPEAEQAGTATAAVRGGEDFANRLRKNLKHLSKWARRNEIDNYRAYDADLPDYALAIDLYHEYLSARPDAAEPLLHAHVQEYAAPDSIDPVRAEKRLRAALAQLQQILDLPSTRLHYKLRQSQRGSAQYTRQNEQNRYARIREHGCWLWANFDDYLDTGLFLDHRPLRLRIQREARGKRFLNLFCYTGSATAQAAVGGALASLSVDLSNTYLEWAERNLRLNGVEPQITLTRGQAYGHVRAAHRLLRADCLVWLREQAANPAAPKFDLILCDPPTFSNSKKMEGVLDTQRDHADIIEQAHALLAPGGRLYFSTNRRRFRLDAERLAALEPQDITPQTLDEDFKRPPVAHRCWLFDKTA